MNKRFSRLEANVMSLARSLSQLSNDMHHQAVNVHQIELIKKDIAEVCYVVLTISKIFNHSNLQRNFTCRITLYFYK